RTDAAFDDFFAATVGGADDLAGLNSPADPDHGICRRPVVATGLDGSGRTAGDAAAAAGYVRDARRPPEFAGDDDQDSAIETAIINVFNECCDRLVEDRRAEFYRLETVMIDGMIVPVRDAAA